VEERPSRIPSFDDPETIARELIDAQIELVKEAQKTVLKTHLENVDIMISSLRILCKRDEWISRVELSETLRLSLRKIGEAIQTLENAELIVRRGDCFKLSNLYKHELTEENIEEVVKKYVASKEDIVRSYEEALMPKHVAISYTGEPMLYPMIGGLVAEFRKKGMTTFIVTNGTIPDRIKNLEEEPSQLYVTLAAPDKETYIKTCFSVLPQSPILANGWERLNETLDLLSTLSCRTCIRITAVKGVNMVHPEKYRQLVERANPNFVEVKGFTDTGYAYRIARRLGEFKGSYDKDDDVKYLKRVARERYKPSHEEIVNFAKQISDNWRIFPFIGESKESCYVLMGVNWKDLKDTIIKKP
jgi:wyosine [tRNA(Phe)-imidazoG37] synthetase (radical SAM superfamily)